MTARRSVQRVGGVFAEMHRGLMGASAALPPLDVAEVPAELRGELVATWSQRFLTEFRSVQVMHRFLGELLATGEPLEVYAGAVELVADEIRHMALCADLLRALGAPVNWPEPQELTKKAEFRAAPPIQRALATAISMLVVNETLSVAYVRDLHARCDQPTVKALLAATVEDEAGHEDFGWEYVAKSLQRFPSDSLPMWRQIVQDALHPQRSAAERIVTGLPEEKRTLEAWPDMERARWGLFSPERQALLCLQTIRTGLVPRLTKLGLWQGI